MTRLLRGGQNVGSGQMVAADFILTPDVLISDDNAGGIGGALGRFGRRGVGLLGIGGGTAIGGGGYTDTEEGKVIAASFLDNFNNIVVSLKDNPNMDQYGASGDDTVIAGEVFTAW